MQEQNFDEILQTILLRDPRYDQHAYLFVREALDHTQKKVHQGKKHLIRHVSGQELLEGIREYALAQYGPMAITLLEEWGIKRCEDFGEIVFNLVEAGLLSKTDQDSRKDFAGNYDFKDAFRKPFVPKSKRIASHEHKSHQP
jgi:uncharacterized repeat protein (TIGR04138 family)